MQNCDCSLELEGLLRVFGLNLSWSKWKLHEDALVFGSEGTVSSLSFESFMRHPRCVILHVRASLDTDLYE